MDKLLDSINENPNSTEVRAAGSILHDFYCGVEKIFEKIALFIDNEIPKGDNWHSELLIKMSIPIENIRKTVITEDLLKKLKEHLRFRHLFRHIYGFELKWDRFKDLCMNLNITFEAFRTELNSYAENNRE